MLSASGPQRFTRPRLAYAQRRRTGGYRRSPGRRASRHRVDLQRRAVDRHRAREGLREAHAVAREDLLAQGGVGRPRVVELPVDWQ